MQDRSRLERRKGTEDTLLSIEKTLPGSDIAVIESCGRKRARPFTIRHEICSEKRRVRFSLACRVRDRYLPTELGSFDKGLGLHARSPATVGSRQLF